MEFHSILTQLPLPAWPYTSIQLAYVGPETVLPLASVVAAIVGAALMVWHRTFGIVRGVFRLVIGKNSPRSEGQEPGTSRDTEGDGRKEPH